jgi:glycosyltransferase involved in cell wall biosynthesis
MWGGSPSPPIHERVLDAIPGFLVWLAFFFCIACAVAFPRTLLLIAALVGLYSALRFLFAGIANFMGLRRIKKWEQTDWHRKYCEEKTDDALNWDDVHHVVIIPAYKEPMSVLRRTLDSLQAQYEADKRITIVLAMEAAEEGSIEKAEQLQGAYQAGFARFHYTVHPRGLPGEMQCKSANENWAARWLKRKLVNEQGYNIDHICITTMDADTRWHPQFFFALTYHFAIDPQRYTRFWQAPIRYHGNIWSINPLLRIVNAYASALELAYLAAPWWKAMPMSSYSLSLRLLDHSGYWDGDVISDEWHMFIKAYFARDGGVSLVPIMLPFMADATIGTNLIDELRERYSQSVRHAWGSKEVGYMIAKMIDHPEVEFWPAFRLLMRISHDIMLAGAGWVILTLGSQLPVLLYPEIAPLQLGPFFQNPAQELADAAARLAADPTWIMVITAATLVVILGIVFWYQDVIVRPPRDTKPTLRERLWTLLSFPLLPVLTLLVLAFPTIQAQTRLMLGIPLRFRVTKKI